MESEPAAAPAAAADIKLPMGLLGFEQIKNYLLIADSAEQPFYRFQVRDDSSLSFVVLEPFLVAPHYQPNLPDLDVQFLGLTSPADALLLGIVTVHPGLRATINLKGPVVINRKTGVGKQVILVNAADYSVQYPLPAA